MRSSYIAVISFFFKSQQFELSTIFHRCWFNSHVENSLIILKDNSVKTGERLVKTRQLQRPVFESFRFLARFAAALWVLRRFFVPGSADRKCSTLAHVLHCTRDEEEENRLAEPSAHENSFVPHPRLTIRHELGQLFQKDCAESGQKGCATIARALFISVAAKGGSPASVPTLYNYY